MVGSGEQYLVAFALALGIDEVVSGLVAAIPMLVGAVIQLASPWGVRHLGSHRRWVLLCASIQAASFLPLAALALVGSSPALLIYLFASLYWGFGLATGPAWNTWMEGLIPQAIRPRFFAARTRVTQAGQVAGLLGAGLVLQFGKSHGSVLPAFAVLFFTAAAARFFSAWQLARQSETPPAAERLQLLDWQKLRQHFRQGSGGVLLYMLCVQMAAFISGPYFTPYIIKRLDFSYGGFMLLTAAALLGKVVALPYFGRFANERGTRKLLWLGGLGIVPLSAFWNVSDNFYFLLLLQAAAGVAWAAYELAMLLTFFETIDARQRTGVLTLYNLGHAAATVAGSLLGGQLLRWLGETQGAYHTLFLISGLTRLSALLLLAYVTGMFGRLGNAWRSRIGFRAPAVEVQVPAPHMATVAPTRRTAMAAEPVAAAPLMAPLEGIGPLPTSAVGAMPR